MFRMAVSRALKPMVRQIDAAGLAVFRFWFFGIVVWEVWRFFKYDRVSRYFQEPEWAFKYFGFDWVQPFSGDGMVWVFLLLGFAAALAACGALYRVTAPLVAILLAYMFLLDQARYLNHIYLMFILAALLALMPLNRCLAVDAQLRLSPRSDEIEFWSYGSLKLQLAMVFVFAAIAKLNIDWFSGNPMGQWLAARNDLTLLGGVAPVGRLFNHASAGIFFAWSGFAVDLFVPFLLLYRKTRWIGVVVSVLFHFLNSFIFNIGVFPWLMLGAMTIFFEPDWPRRIFNMPDRGNRSPLTLNTNRAVIALLLVHFAVQLALPFRHWIYPGDVAWTEEGHRFSWRMKLRDKDAGGYFSVHDPSTSISRRVYANEVVSEAQARAMWPRPDMILQLAHEIARRHQVETGVRPEVRVVVRASLNHRPAEFLIDPSVDLAKVKRTLLPVDWITRPKRN